MESFASLVCGPPPGNSASRRLAGGQPAKLHVARVSGRFTWDDLPEVAQPVVETADAAGQKQILLDVPAMGFAWVGPGQGEPPAAEPKKRTTTKKDHLPPLAQGNTLKNEHLEVTISPVTGGIQAIHNHAVRANRLGQQIAMRMARPGQSREDGEPGGEQEYSIMAADDVSVVEAGPLVGRIQSRGRLMDREGRRLARFVQTAEIRHGSRILELRIDLEIERQPEPEPWSSYYAVRFAWTDETADTYRSVGLAAQQTETAFLESPLFCDISAPRSRMTILCARASVSPAFRAAQAGYAAGRARRDGEVVPAGDRHGPRPSCPSGARFSGRRATPAASGTAACQSVGLALSRGRAGRRGHALGAGPRRGQAGRVPRPAPGDRGTSRPRRIAGLSPLASARTLDLLGPSGWADNTRWGDSCTVAPEGGSTTATPTTDSTPTTELPVEGDRTTLDLGPHQWTHVEALFAG